MKKREEAKRPKGVARGVALNRSELYTTLVTHTDATHPQRLILNIRVELRTRKYL